MIIGVTLKADENMHINVEGNSVQVVAVGVIAGVVWLQL